MKPLLLILCLFLRGCAPLCPAAELSGARVDCVARAIFKSEGGYSATFLYGIKSVPYRGEAEARRICENSIRNNYARWQASGCTNDFIPFMAARYCPFDRTNWTRNVKFFLAAKERRERK